MLAYQWPGNVRELQNAIQFATVKCNGRVISPEDLPLELRNYKRANSSSGPSRKLDIDTVKSILEKTGGNKAKAAKRLGIGRATLYRFLAKYPEVIENI